MTVAEQLIIKGRQQGLERGLEQGLEQGMHIEKTQIAKNLLNSGLELDFVAKNTGLDIDFLKKLQEETKH